jgi:hypothetical protein
MTPEHCAQDSSEVYRVTSFRENARDLPGMGSPVFQCLWMSVRLNSRLTMRDSACSAELLKKSL